MAIKYLTFLLVVTKVDAIIKFEETARGHVFSKFITFFKRKPFDVTMVLGYIHHRPFPDGFIISG